MQKKKKKTFLNVSQSDFDTAADFYGGFYRHMHYSRHKKIMLCVREALTLMRLLFSVMQF